MRNVLRGFFLLLISFCIAGCNASLPEPESESAKLYQQRCSGCHRLYHPGLLTPEMWQFMMVRMQKEFQRIGRPPLSELEKTEILGYLTKHSQKPSAQPANDSQVSIMLPAERPQRHRFL